MPVYEYLCPNGHVTEHLRKIKDRRMGAVCSRCTAIARLAILHPPKVFGDYDGYLSPSSGQWVEGRRARQEDLLRTGCRPFEAGEREAAQRRAAQNERALDASVEEATERTLNEITL